MPEVRRAREGPQPESGLPVSAETKGERELCDACNVRPDWLGEHRCHRGGCTCEVCREPTPEELAEFMAEEVS